MVEKGKQFKVLDHGYVTYIDSMGTDESIIEAARMSTGRGFEGWEDRTLCTNCGVDRQNTLSDTCEKTNSSHDWKRKPGDLNLLDFLWRNKHATPFEMCELQIEVQAPIMVFREWHRHRTQSYNEFSARYAVMPDRHYVPDAPRFDEVVSANKQAASEGKLNHRTSTGATSEALKELVAQEQRDIYAHYSYMLDCGVPKEVARLNTPVSRYSKMRAKTDLRNWLAFLNLRMRPNAQYEIRQYAIAVAEIIKSIWPRTYELFEEYDMYGASLSRKEIRAIRAALHSKGDEQWINKELFNTATTLGLSESMANALLQKILTGGSVIG